MLRHGLLLVILLAVQVSVRLDLAHGVQRLLSSLVLVLDVLGEDLGGELGVDDLHGVGDYVVLLGQRPERRQYGIVDVFE